MKEMNELSRTDREILNVLQADFPLTSQPYRDIAEKMNLDEEEVIARIPEVFQNHLDI